MAIRALPIAALLLLALAACGDDGVSTARTDGGPAPSDQLDPEGPQRQGGEGWRLLGHGPAGPGDATVAATNEHEYAELWSVSGLAGEAPPVDLDTEIVVLFGTYVSGSCPEIRLDDVVVDDVTRSVTASYSHPGLPADCTSDANPYGYVVALDRAVLPAQRFSVGDQETRTFVNPAEDSPLVVIVSNQSFVTDPVDITIEVDGEVVVSQDFAVEGQHTWLYFGVDVEPGTHTLVATSERTGARLEETFDVPAQRWALVQFWHDEPDTAPYFTWDLFEEPPAFA
jgi:hypothetical protein